MLTFKKASRQASRKLDFPPESNRSFGLFSLCCLLTTLPTAPREVATCSPLPQAEILAAFLTPLLHFLSLTTYWHVSACLEGLLIVISLCLSDVAQYVAVVFGSDSKNVLRTFWLVQTLPWDQDLEQDSYVSQPTEAAGWLSLQWVRLWVMIH